jgi:predicted nucleotide-binding protein
VFITHGKNRAIVNQLKEILQFGKFEPVVAEEQETTSRPVPEKVLSSMRDCFAGVIHIEEERELMDPDGKTYQYLNQNELIEIGAAMALYGNNFVLLVKKGVTLPSNLQGLYRCDYEGDRLDYEATMKLLRTFNSFDQ